MIAAIFGLSVFLLLNAIQSDVALPIATDGEGSEQQQQLPELQKSQQIDELPLQQQQQQPQQSDKINAVEQPAASNSEPVQQQNDQNNVSNSVQQQIAISESSAGRISNAGGDDSNARVEASWDKNTRVMNGPDCIYENGVITEHGQQRNATAEETAAIVDYLKHADDVAKQMEAALERMFDAFPKSFPFGGADSAAVGDDKNAPNNSTNKAPFGQQQWPSFQLPKMPNIQLPAVPCFCDSCKAMGGGGIDASFQQQQKGTSTSTAADGQQFPTEQQPSALDMQQQQAPAPAPPSSWGNDQQQPVEMNAPQPLMSGHDEEE